MKYDYTFSLWVFEELVWEKALLDVFRLLNTRVQMTFTETEFAKFRSNLAFEGFTMRAITRVPHHEQEAVL